LEIIIGDRVFFFYTEMNSKVGNLVRRRLEFELGAADAEAAQFK
jgi:hypothetical protein